MQSFDAKHGAFDDLLALVEPRHREAAGYTRQADEMAGEEPSLIRRGTPSLRV